MRYLRRHIITRILLGLVTATILNLSVDAPDFHQNTVAEDLSFNDIESVVEWLLEDVCEIENAIPEYDDDDSEHGKLPKHDQQFQPFYKSFGVNMSLIADYSRKNSPNFGILFFSDRTATSELFQPPEV